MDNASKIKQLLQQITGTEQSVFLFRPMEVVSVEGDTCRARYNELEIPGIRLAAIEGGADGGLLLKPATGSIVLVADLSCGELRECSVIGYSEIEALTYRHGDTTVTMNGNNVSATVGRMQLKVTADGVEINGGKQGGLVLAAALRRSPGKRSALLRNDADGRRCRTDRSRHWSCGQRRNGSRDFLRTNGGRNHLSRRFGG